MKLALSACVAIFAATSAFADGLDTAQNASSAMSWEGLYGGATFSKTTSGSETWNGGSPDYNLEGDMFGAFVGYNHVLSNGLVLGAEAAYFSADVNESDLDTGEVYGDWGLTNMLDLKAKVGYASGKALFFVSGGYSTGSYNGEGDKVTMTGYNYGVGVDFAVSKNILAGVEFVHRKVDNDDAWGTTLVDEFDSIQARIAYKF